MRTDGRNIESILSRKAISLLGRKTCISKVKCYKNLRDVGYEAYLVDQSTYSTLEEELKIDFSEMGVDERYSFIVIIGGMTTQDTSDNSNENDRSVISGTFNHTYNGNTYLMRYFTITADDNYHYGQTTQVNVLNSSNSSYVSMILQSVLSSVVDDISGCFHFGTILSILGLTISQVNTSQNSIVNFTGGTNWTRTYTQIYETSSDMWFSWSAVDYVTTNAWVDATLCNSNLNSYVHLTDHATSSSQYTEHYYDYTWRKNQAAIGRWYSTIRYERTGNVFYEYDSNPNDNVPGTVIITHFEWD